jgi:hypothetical protein
MNVRSLSPHRPVARVAASGRAAAPGGASRLPNKIDIDRFGATIDLLCRHG